VILNISISISIAISITIIIISNTFALGDTQSQSANGYGL